MTARSPFASVVPFSEQCPEPRAFDPTHRAPKRVLQVTVRPVVQLRGVMTSLPSTGIEAALLGKMPSQEGTGFVEASSELGITRQPVRLAKTASSGPNVQTLLNVDEIAFGPVSEDCPMPVGLGLFDETGRLVMYGRVEPTYVQEAGLDSFVFRQQSMKVAFSLPTG